MAARRKSVPKAVHDAVMKEFNNLCSICGEPRPQLHHIDKNRDNNDHLNLLPLCPNCHLSDQHNPTSQIDPGILALFRAHKDPTILMPESEPIFRRLRAISALLDQQRGPERRYSKWMAFWTAVDDLVRFLHHLNMGQYYSSRFEESLQLIGLLPHIEPGEERSSGSINIPQLEKGIAEWEQTQGILTAMLIEMLRYQSWSRTPNRVNKATARRKYD